MYPVGWSAAAPAAPLGDQLHSACRAMFVVAELMQVWMNIYLIIKEIHTYARWATTNTVRYCMLQKR